MDGPAAREPAPSPRRLVIAITTLGAELARVRARTARLTHLEARGLMTPAEADQARTLRAVAARLDAELAGLRAQLAAARR